MSDLHNETPLDLRDAEIARLHQQPKDTRDAEIAKLEQELNWTRGELDEYRLASERAIYDAQQFDASLYLNTDRGVEDVMRRVLARLGEYEGENKRLHAFETVKALVKERDLWERRANALLEIAKAATDIVGAAYTIQDSGNYVVSGVEYERLRRAVETYKRMSEQEAEQ